VVSRWLSIYSAVAFDFTMCQKKYDEVEVVVFLTEKAKELNWLDCYKDRRDSNGNVQSEFNTGLQSSFNKLDPQISLKEVPISAAQDETANWELFDKILQELHENDTIYFDMTHGFRSIPFVSFIVLNYARFLKNINLGGLLYGIKNDDTTGSIINFTEMMNLLDWAEGVNQYLRTGNAEIINAQVNKEKAEILKTAQPSKGEGIMLGKMGHVAERMNSLNDAFETVRGEAVFSEIDRLLQVTSEIEAIDSDYLRALIPLIEKVKEKLAAYSSNEAEKIKFVVNWCIEHGLIQQGYTFLLEYVISAFCDYVAYDKMDLKWRKVVSETIGHLARKRPESRWRGSQDHIKNCITFKAKITQFDVYFPIYHELNHIRNDLNHAGAKKDAFSSKIILDKLSVLSEKLYPLIDTLYENMKQEGKNWVNNC